jgi:signal transduction histidine kinase
MNLDWTTLFTSLGRSPWDLVYHLVVGSALLVLLSVAKRGASPRSKPQNHLLVGAILLFSLQLLLLILNKEFNLPDRLPALQADLVESLVHALSLVWLIWTFIEQDESFLVTGAAIFTSLACVLWGAASLGLVLLQPAFLPADNTWMLAVWDLGGFILSAIGCLVMWVKRPQGWGVGTALLLVLGLGHGLQLFITEIESLRPGALRLAQTLSFPWILVLVQRLMAARPGALSEPEAARQTDSKPALVDELLKLSQLEKVDEKHQAAARALSLYLIADMCYLVEIDKAENSLRLLAGYDLIRECPLPTPRLSKEDLPNILKAWEKAEPYQPNHPPINIRDAAALTEIFNYHRIGRVLAYPLPAGDQGLKGGVIFLSPYTDKAFNQSALNLMAQIESTLADVLFKPGPEARLSAELAETRQKLSQFQDKARKFSQALSDAHETQSKQEKEIGQLKARYQIEKLKIVKEMDACEEKIVQLSAQAALHQQDIARLEALKSHIKELTAEKEGLARELSQAATRIADLEGEIRSASVIKSPAQNEILSLDAIAANTELSFSSRCQQREVSLEIANPDGGQLIKTDPGHLQTLISSLLENALLACQPGGLIHFQIKLSYETGMLQIQVTDSGEGLTSGEQRALFDQTEEPPAGIGSHQALREAVRMVQSLNGKIWLRSQPGESTTFRVQIPVRILD